MNTCRRKNTTSPATYRAIVRDYIENHRDDASRVLRFYAIQRNLGDAVDNASFARLPGGKRHSHQYRIPNTVLARVQERLREADLGKCKTFHELHGSVGAAAGDISGVGELMVYDTAHRIGAFLRLEPEFVYLHAGTRDGAAALGFPRSRDRLDMQELPEEFLQLRPHEVEDCLCIYKKELKEASNKTPGHVR